MPMVSYQTFVTLAFDVARQKGAQFDGIDDGGDFLSDVAALWSSNTEQYRQMTQQQARNALERRVQA
jgi:hypothetical protein